MSTLIYLLLSFVVLAVAWVVFIRIRHDYRKYGKLTPGASFLQVVVFFLHGPLMGYFTDPDWPTSHGNLFLTVFGVTLLLVGAFLTITIMVQFGWKRAIGREVNILQQSGWYRWSRNPQIVSYGLFVLGYALAWFSWRAVVWVSLYAVIVHIMVMVEEEHLRRVFGEEYLRYCEQTPRYIGIPKKAGQG